MLFAARCVAVNSSSRARATGRGASRCLAAAGDGAAGERLRPVLPGSPGLRSDRNRTGSSGLPDWPAGMATRGLSHSPTSKICRHDGYSHAANGVRRFQLMRITVVPSPSTGTGPRLKNQRNGNAMLPSGWLKRAACTRSQPRLDSPPKSPSQLLVGVANRQQEDVVARLLLLHRRDVVPPRRLRSPMIE